MSQAKCLLLGCLLLLCTIPTALAQTERASCDSIVSPEGIVLRSYPSGVGTGERLTTSCSFRPPVEITVVAKTDSTNLRLAYAADQIIFNWELDRTQLRVDGGPANGKHRMGAGGIPVDQYVTVRWLVTATKQSIYVDGQLRYEDEGDYSRIFRPVTVFAAEGSTLTVRSVLVRRLETAAAEPSPALTVGPQIETAVYASPHGQSFDVTPQLRSSCAATPGSCSVSCNNQLAGDPDFGTVKYCRIVYVCAGEQPQGVRIEEGQHATLGCATSPTGSEIHSASTGLIGSGLQIKNATYASPRNHRALDITTQLRSSCPQGAASCTVSCGNQLAGDPDFGQIKYCAIWYQCGNTLDQVLRMDEGQRANLCAASAAPSAQSAAPPQSAPPHQSSRLQSVSTAAQRWAGVGNFNRAAVLMETLAESPDTTPSDRFLANGELQRFYGRLDDRADLLRVEQARLSSDYFGTYAGTADSGLIQRAGAMLQIARDQLALQRFAEASQSAAGVLQLLGSRSGEIGGIGVLAEERSDAKQIATLAQAQQSVLPPAKTFIDRAAGAVTAAQPPFSAKEADNACGIVLQHANAGTLGALSVAWSSLPDTSSGAPRAAFDQLGPIDLFGDGKPVLVGIDSGALNAFGPDGSRAALLESPDQDWNEDDGSDPMLLRVADHYYVLARDGNQLRYLSEFSRNHVERKACEFESPSNEGTEPSPAVPPHYRLLTPLEQLIADAKSLNGYTLTRYVMVEPGLDAARLVLDASRRKDNPIALVPEPGAYDSYGESIVNSAVKAHRYDVLKFLLDNGVDPNLGDHGLRFNTMVLPDVPLLLAVKNDDLTAAQILLAHGAQTLTASARGKINVLAGSSSSASLAMFSLLLDAGANPNLVPPVGFVADAVQRSPNVVEVPAKIDLLLRHGADPDAWVHALFNAIARRSGLAAANDRMERDGGSVAESATYTPVKTEWVQQLLASPVRAPDNGLEPLLREASAIRSAANCRRGTRLIPKERPCQLRQPAPADLGTAGLARPAPTAAALAPSSVPLTDRAVFVAYAAGQLQRRLPGFTVTMDAGYPSMLIVDPRGAKLGHTNVQQTYEWCRDRAGPCDELFSRWLQTAQTGVENLERTPDPDDLILLVGPREMLEKLAAPRAASAPPLAMRPCLAYLYCLLAAKEPTLSQRLVDERDLTQMHLTIDQAMQLAREHLQAQLQAISALRVPSAAEPIAFNDDTELEGSRLVASPSEWAELAAHSGGTLIAAVPAANIVVYARGDDPQAVQAMHQFIEAVYPTAVLPVSTQLLRWSANGWSVLP